MRYAVGIDLATKSQHIVLEAEDALIAAPKVKSEKPDAMISYVMISYVRRQNTRGAARHPAQKLRRPTRRGGMTRAGCGWLASQGSGGRFREECEIG
jgi:hypothetical protein